MEKINVQYDGLSKTAAIENFIKNKVDKLSRLLENATNIVIHIKDITPHKKTNIMEFQVVVNFRNTVMGKTQKIAIHHKEKNLYNCIEKAVDMTKEILRREHDKNTTRYKHFKNILKERYQELMLQSDENII